MPLINCEIELDLKWSKYCVFMEDGDNIRGVSFTITSTQLYVAVVTLSITDNMKFLENIKKGFKRAISWNRYRSEITTQPKNNNSNYLIDSTLGILIDYLHFHSKMEMMIIQEIHLIDINCH